MKFNTENDWTKRKKITNFKRSLRLFFVCLFASSSYFITLASQVHPERQKKKKNLYSYRFSHKLFPLFNKLHLEKELKEIGILKRISFFCRRVIWHPFTIYYLPSRKKEESTFIRESKKRVILVLPLCVVCCAEMMKVESYLFIPLLLLPIAKCQHTKFLLHYFKVQFSFDIRKI